jgi:hypothetical protein
MFSICQRLIDALHFQSTLIVLDNPNFHILE